MGNESGGVSSLFSDYTTATVDVASSMSAMMKLLLRVDAGAAFMWLEIVMPFFDLRRGAVAAGAKRPRLQTFAYLFSDVSSAGLKSCELRSKHHHLKIGAWAALMWTDMVMPVFDLRCCCYWGEVT